MIDYLKAERIKMKGTVSKKILFIIPFFFLLFSLFTTLLSTQSGDFNVYIAVIFNHWPLLFLPIGLAIACSLNSSLEKKSGNYKGIISNNLSLSKIWYSKIINMIIYQLISSLLIVVVAVSGSIFVYSEVPKVLNVIYTSILITLAALPLIPFNFLLSQLFNTIITLLINLLGAFISVVWLAPNTTFWLTPWANMLRIPAVTMGIHPNGTSIEGVSSLRDPSALGISITVSGIYLIVMLVLSVIIFKKVIK